MCLALRSVSCVSVSSQSSSVCVLPLHVSLCHSSCIFVSLSLSSTNVCVSSPVSCLALSSVSRVSVSLLFLCLLVFLLSVSPPPMCVYHPLCLSVRGTSCPEWCIPGPQFLLSPPSQPPRRPPLSRSSPGPSIQLFVHGSHLLEFLVYCLLPHPSCLTSSLSCVCAARPPSFVRACQPTPLPPPVTHSLPPLIAIVSWFV